MWASVSKSCLGILLLLLASGCTSSPSEDSSASPLNAPGHPQSSGSQDPSLSDQQAFYSSQIQELNSLNNDPAYELSAADLELLKAQGVTSSEDEAQLQSLVKR